MVRKRQESVENWDINESLCNGLISDRAFCSSFVDIRVGIYLKEVISRIRREMDVRIIPMGKAAFIVTIMDEVLSRMSLWLN